MTDMAPPNRPESHDAASGRESRPSIYKDGAYNGNLVDGWVELLTDFSLDDLRGEIARQDDEHRVGYSKSRDDVRLALAAIEDELRESLDAWRVERKAADWRRTATEVLQLAAVAVRLYRSTEAMDEAHTRG